MGVLVLASRSDLFTSPFESVFCSYLPNGSQCAACNYGNCGVASNCPGSPVRLIKCAALSASVRLPSSPLNSCLSLVFVVPYRSTCYLNPRGSGQENRTWCKHRFCMPLPLSTSRTFLSDLRGVQLHDKGTV